ncbi:ubiquitin-2 like Rad60 SUMO-like-domain-containing protein [Coniochaeta sp. 2T2.1]|nr:ubiquitin-2 like Rad60 SUMO-like-domain-containing protein [Coniochaeta sp. 2T2.1]
MADSATAAPPKKKLPFKRTIARRKSPDPSTKGTAKKEEDDDDDGVDLFRRVDELPEVLAEQERRVKRSEKRSSYSAVKSDPDGEDVKRRKLSVDPDEERRNGGTPRRSSSNRGSVSGSASKPRSASADADEDIFSRGKGKGKAIAKSKDSPKTIKARPFSPPDTITLDSSDEVKAPPTPGVPRSGALSGRRTCSQRLLSPKPDDGPIPISFEDNRPARADPSDDDDDDDLQIVENPQEEEVDDEFEEYVRRARAKAEERERQAKIKLERGSQATPSQETKPSAHSSFAARSDSNNDSQGSNMDEPVINIMVSSHIPGMKAKMMTRRINHNLRAVKVAFLSRHNIPMAMHDEYFLTWKGNRIYATTTPAELGIRVAKGRPGDKIAAVVGAKGAHSSHGNGFHENGLHLEAWTEETYQEYLREKERERRRLLGQLDDDDDDLGDKIPGSGYQSSQDPGGDGGVGEEATTRIILKAAKDYDLLKFKVHAHTTIDEMITTFRENRKVPEDKEISLFFDGEKLDGDLAVRDTEIEDMDSIEVHIK